VIFLRFLHNLIYAQGQSRYSNTNKVTDPTTANVPRCKGFINLNLNDFFTMDPTMATFTRCMCFTHLNFVIGDERLYRNRAWRPDVNTIGSLS
jgi:hypothetical protein